MDKLQLQRNDPEPRGTWCSYPAYSERSGYGYSSFDGSQSDGLLYYWRVLCRHKLVLIMITVLGALAAVIVTLPQTPVYQGRVALEIQDINQNFLNIQQVNPVSLGTGYTALTDLQTQAKLLASDSLVRRVLQKLNDRIPEDLKADTDRFIIGRDVINATIKVKDSILELAGIGSSLEPKQSHNLPVYSSNVNRNRQTPSVNRQKATKTQVSGETRSDHPSGANPKLESADNVDLLETARNLKIRPARQTRVLEVLYDSSDPRFAADFVNTLAQEFIDSNMEARWKMSQQTSEWLSRQLNDMRAKLERSDDALQKYARRTGLMFTSEKDNIAEEKLRQLQQELSKAQADRVSAQSRWEISKARPPDALPEVLNDNSLRALQDKVTELRRQEAELITIYTEKHSKVRRVAAQIAPLEAALRKERSAIVDRVDNDYQAALRREKLLRADYLKQSELVVEQADKSIQYNILKREVESNRQLYDAMLQRVKEASIASAMRASNVRIVDPAEPPKHPYRPSLPTNVTLGLLSGLLIGVAVVIARERSDRTLRAPGEARFWLNLPELQVIPTLANEEGRSRQITKHSKTLSLSAPQSRGAQTATAVAGVLNCGRTGADAGSVELVTWLRKPSMIAESFRSLLTSILLSRENGESPRVLVVTSASPAEGKTTVVSNLGIALAQIKRKVLIIDADFRKPRIHEVFGLPNRRGLNTLLENSSVSAEPLDGVVRETNVPGLFVLPSGPPNDTAANLVYSENLPILLAGFRQEFDMVIIDTAPMLVMPDARVLGRMADGVILITRAGRTMRDAAVAATQRFSEDSIRVLGTILNDWDPKKSQDRYGYGSGYHQRAS